MSNKLQEIGDGLIEEAVGADLGFFIIKFDGDQIEFWFKSQGEYAENVDFTCRAIRVLNRERFQYKPCHIGRVQIVLEKCKESDNREFFQRDDNGDYIDPVI